MINNHAFFPKTKITNCRNLALKSDATIDGVFCTQTPLAFNQANNTDCNHCCVYSGSIIPFASGKPIFITTLPNGSSGIPAFIGFGNSASGMSPLENTINIQNSKCNCSNFAFSCPRKVHINQITTFFSTCSLLCPNRPPVIVKAQLYSASETSNIFSPIEETSIDLSPQLSSTDSIGTICTGKLSNICIPINPDIRLMLVYSLSSSNSSQFNRITGYASAGVSII